MNRKHDSLFKNENWMIQTLHKREAFDISKNKGKLIKIGEENKFKKYEDLELPADISQINEYFISLQALNPCKNAKESFSQLENEQLIKNEDLVIDNLIQLNVLLKKFLKEEKNLEGEEIQYFHNEAIGSLLEELLLIYISLGRDEIINLIISYFTKVIKINSETYIAIIKSNIIKTICFIFEKDFHEAITNNTIKYSFKFLFHCFSVNECFCAEENVSFDVYFLCDVIKLGFILFNGYSSARVKADIYIIKTISAILMNFKNQELPMSFCVCFDLFNKIIKALSHNPSKFLLFEIQQMLGRIFLYNEKIIQRFQTEETFTFHNELCLNFKKTLNNYSARKEEKGLINYILIFIVDYYIMLLDSNNSAFIGKFLVSDLFTNLTFFDEQEELKPFFGNLYYVLFQTSTKPNARFDLLELLFSREKIVNYFDLILNNSEVSSVYRLNLLMNFDLLVKEIGKTVFDPDKIEQYANLYPNVFGYLNDFNQKVIGK